MKLPEVEMRRRRQRLKDAIEKKFAKSADKLGQAMGYKDGAFLRQMLTNDRSVTEKTVQAIESLDGMRGWFAAGPWPFERVSRDLFESLSEREKGAVEDAMIEKIDAIKARQPSKQARA